MLSKSDLKRLIVKIEGFSGCLVRPMGADATYILTADHDLKNLAAGTPLDIKRSVIVGGRPLYENVPFPALQKDVNYFPHEELDAAILKVDFIPDVDQLTPAPGEIVDEQLLLLLGYPVTRRHTDEEFKINELRTIMHTDAGMWEAQIVDFATQPEVKGQSGGAIVRLTGGTALLVGVQSQMTGAGETRAAFVPIEAFSEIVAASSGALQELVPHFLESFEHVRALAMKLVPVLDPRHVESTKNFLDSIAAEVINAGMTPLRIKDKYNDRLLVCDSETHQLIDKRMWISWLAFLVVMLVIRDNYDLGENELEEMFNKFRLRYHDHNGDWFEIADKYLLADYYDIDQDAVVIISTPNRPEVREYIGTATVQNIARRHGIVGPKMKIDQGKVNWVKQIPIVHLSSFEVVAILRKAEEYAGYALGDEADLKAKLKTEFLKILDVRNN